jgi:hypothetical protein
VREGRIDQTACTCRSAQLIEVDAQVAHFALQFQRSNDGVQLVVANEADGLQHVDWISSDGKSECLEELRRRWRCPFAQPVPYRLRVPTSYRVRDVVEGFSVSLAVSFDLSAPIAEGFRIVRRNLWTNHWSSIAQKWST